MLLIVLLIEATLISAYGGTPGKALMGIAVCDRHENRRLGFGRSFGRSFNCLFKGLGFGLPVVAIVTCIAAFRTLETKESEGWDDDANAKVATRSVSGFRWGVGIFLWLAGLALLTAFDRATAQ